jgi:hypothetical protein
MSSRKILTNVWGNINGYVGRKKVKEFGTNDIAAGDWVIVEKKLDKELFNKLIEKLQLNGTIEFDEHRTFGDEIQEIANKGNISDLIIGTCGWSNADYFSLVDCFK